MLNPRLVHGRPARGAVARTLSASCALAILVTSATASAQSGPLSGHVYDTSGAVLPGVEVVLEDERQVKWPTTTDGAGRFEFTPIGVGRYVLHVSIPGFKTLRDEFELRATGQWIRDMTLQVGQLQETIRVTARRRRPPADSAQAGEAGPRLRIGGNIKQPAKLAHVSPVYPADMRDAGLEGVVSLEAVIGTDGTVVAVRPSSAQAHPAFARAAEAAVRQWRFSQTLLNGVPIEVVMTVSVSFGLED
jgi:TonB family protein